MGSGQPRDRGADCVSGKAVKVLLGCVSPLSSSGHRSLCCWIQRQSRLGTPTLARARPGLISAADAGSSSFQPGPGTTSPGKELSLEAGKSFRLDF